MNHTLRRITSALVLLALGLGVLACDSASSNDGPSWTGNWTIASVGGTNPDASLDYRITEENFIVVVRTGSCTISEGTVSRVEGNELTVSFDGTDSRIRAEADDKGTSTELDDEITLTVLEGRIPGGPGAPRATTGDTVTGDDLNSGDPRALCP
jgi:hypothetical protein